MESLVEENARLRQEVAELKAANERLERRVQELQSCYAHWKRPNAPGNVRRRRSRGVSRKPILPSLGGKRGAQYGRRCRRPLPQKVHQSLEAELPGCCPLCGGELEETRIENQYQAEIPQPRVERIEFHIHFGRCKRCGRRVQGRHPRQSSDAV